MFSILNRLFNDNARQNLPGVLCAFYVEGVIISGKITAVRFVTTYQYLAVALQTNGHNKVKMNNSTEICKTGLPNGCETKKVVQHCRA
jgi:hypothetical protein